MVLGVIHVCDFSPMCVVNRLCIEILERRVLGTPTRKSDVYMALAGYGAAGPTLVIGNFKIALKQGLPNPGSSKICL